jgi:hypothetical protein
MKGESHLVDFRICVSKLLVEIVLMPLMKCTLLHSMKMPLNDERKLHYVMCSCVQANL